ncbi:hypothetical protein IMSHALPRED_003085 [Imshaugia aleurites]|uniref:Uncharacterized protein n=1 Tax=Imshaugia aleurites TaxID=172621 RepID=A0A8H3J756_9LECA|nr:hypothetical protein IMSHALPRED_003085 [Imshaugia aleurites]
MTGYRQQRLRTVSSYFIQKVALKVNTTEFTVPSYDKLKAYIDAKSKDDPWSPYAIQDIAAGEAGKKDT